MRDAVLRGYLRHRFAWLFASLLLTIGAHPLADDVVSGIDPLELLLAVNLVAAIGTAVHDTSFRVLSTLVVAFGVTRGVVAVMGVEGLLSVSQGVWVLAGMLATVATFRHAMRARVVDAEHIFAALDAYLLAGLMFGVGYWVLEQGWPASFGATMERDLELSSAVYFSFVTIATLGYGDVVPASAGARSVAILEALVGQMYLAVLVARLVSLHVVKERGDAEQD